MVDVRLNHVPRDLVRIRAIAIRIAQASEGNLRSWAKVKDRKKAIIKYPPRIFGDGNVPIARLSTRISLA